MTLDRIEVLTQSAITDADDKVRKPRVRILLIKTRTVYMLLLSLRGYLLSFTALKKRQNATLPGNEKEKFLKQSKAKKQTIYNRVSADLSR